MHRELIEQARKLRCEIVKMLYEAGSGHPGASLSSADIVTALFFRVMRHDPKNPHWKGRDRFFLSKGHAAPVLYAALALSGYFPPAELATLRKLGSRLQGHPNMKCPGVEVSTGSLGQGFSIAAGVAWALRSEESPSRIFALLGDGECNEGIVWEAAMFASHHHLANLTAIIDCNGMTNDGLLREIMDMEPLEEKWNSFGWQTVAIDGHDMGQIVEALGLSPGQAPRCVLAKTVKGKGVRYLEANKAFHTKGPTASQLRSALIDLGCET